MRTGPAGPDEPRWQDEMAARRASLSAVWALALGRFRDYLHWVSEPAGDPRREGGETHDRDR